MKPKNCIGNFRVLKNEHIFDMTETIENKVCPYKGVAERDVKRCSISKEDLENPKIYGYSDCLKCNGFKNKCDFYNELKKLKLI